MAIRRYCLAPVPISARILSAGAGHDWFPVAASRSCAVPEIGIGNKPIDGGNYLFKPDEERAELLRNEPKAQEIHPAVRRFRGVHQRN